MRLICSVRFVSRLAVFVVSSPHRFRFRVVSLIVLLAFALPCVTARAGIVGFNNLNGWTYNQSDSSAPADLPNANTIHITNLAAAEARSIFYNTPQPYDDFTASFTFQAQNAGHFCDYGISFIIQKSPAGSHALGQQFGYQGISDSIAVSLQLSSNRSGYFTDGNVGGGSPSVNPVNLTSGHPIDVTLSYDGAILSESLLDTVTPATYTRNFIVNDIASVIGGPEAYIGFGANTTFSTCSGTAADQYISNFHYVPEPATLSLLGVVGGLALLRRRRSAT